ncbi:MAG: RAD55 family ATPase [Candidatus Hydrothermarchaeota archaeon]
MISLGTPEVDGLLEGGVPKGSSVFLEVDEGSSAFSLPLFFLAEALNHGGGGIVTTFERPFVEIIKDLERVDVDARECIESERLFIIDSYVKTLGLGDKSFLKDPISKKIYFTPFLLNKVAFLTKLCANKLMEKGIKDIRVWFCDVGYLISEKDVQAVSRFLKHIIPYSKANEMTLLACGPSPKVSTRVRLLEIAFDVIIRTETVEKEDMFQRKIGIVKARFIPHENILGEYSLTEKGHMSFSFPEKVARKLEKFKLK